MLTQEQKTNFNNELQSWLGTKWVHNQACKGVGADCVQFIVEAVKNVNLLPKSYKTRKYDKDWAMHNARSILREEIFKVADKIDTKEIQEGDIVLFMTGRTSGHLGVYLGNNQLIHSHIQNGVSIAEFNNVNTTIESVWRLKQ